MKISLKLITLIVFISIGCKKYERNNPLDPYAINGIPNIILQNIEIIDHNFPSYYGYRQFSLYITIKNEGGYSGDADPSSGHTDPPEGFGVLKHEHLTKLHFFS